MRLLGGSINARPPPNIPPEIEMRHSAMNWVAREREQREVMVTQERAPRLTASMSPAGERQRDELGGRERSERRPKNAHRRMERYLWPKVILPEMRDTVTP